MMDPKDVGEWQHEEFYRYIAQAHDKPRYTLHYKTDAPLNIRSIFYVPETVSAGLNRPSSACWRSEWLVCSSLSRDIPHDHSEALSLNGDSLVQTSQNLSWQQL